MNYGKELKELRKSLGITQNKLANYLHINRLSISRWENNIIKLDRLKYYGIYYLTCVNNEE